MARRKEYGTVIGPLLNFFLKHPGMSSYEIGRALSLNPAYVRKAISRAGFKLSRSPGSPSRFEILNDGPRRWVLVDHESTDEISFVYPSRKAAQAAALGL